MFSGIIKKTACVISTEKRGKSSIVHIEKPKGWKLTLGESISINGVCTTVRDQGATYFEVEYMPVTLEKTTMGTLKKGDIVNLERSLRMVDAVDGHFVQGHVDVRGKIVSIQDEGATKRLTFRVPNSALKLMVPWGSVTVHGVSLTVQALGKGTFTVALISHTGKHTNLGDLKRGDYVNIETDMIARYLAHLKGA